MRRGSLDGDVRKRLTRWRVIGKKCPAAMADEPPPPITREKIKGFMLSETAYSILPPGPPQQGLSVLGNGRSL